MTLGSITINECTLTSQFRPLCIAQTSTLFSNTNNLPNYSTFKLFSGGSHRHSLHSSYNTTRTCAYTYLRQIFLQPILNSKQVTNLADFTSSQWCEICQVKCVCKQILTYQSKREAHSPKTLNIDSACHSMTLAKQHVLSE